MKLKEIFNAYFSENEETKNLEVVEKTEEQAQKFEEVSLVDGTMINVEPALEIGAVITVMSEDVAVAMPSGEYELEDGRLIVVGENGIIEDIMEVVAEEDAEPVVEEGMNVDTQTAEQEQKAKKIIESIVKEHVFELTEKIEKLEKENDFLIKEKETLTKKFSEFEDFNKQMFSELMQEPSKEPIKEKLNPFGKKEKKKNIFLKN